ncbi:MAG: NifU N-terminal domain-containing protein [Acidimicrobiales bacterium]
MATAHASPTPNPNAMKFTLDVPLAATVEARAGATPDDPFARALVAIDGVESVYGVGTYVTVTRRAGADWGPIVCAVEEAAGQHLAAAGAADGPDKVEEARRLLREAMAPPPTEGPVRLRGARPPDEPQRGS